MVEIRTTRSSTPSRTALAARCSTLANGELTVGELAEPYEMSLAAASKHVKVLERAGLVRRTVEGRTHSAGSIPGRSYRPMRG